MASKGRRCLYKGCGHYRKTHACHFHQFPKNPVATERWLASSGITNVTPKRVTSSMYICSCHFHGGFKSIEHPYPLEYIEEYNEVSTTVCLVVLVLSVICSNAYFQCKYRITHRF